MIIAASLFQKLSSLEEDYIGPLTMVTPSRYVVGGGDVFPVQLETLEQSDRFIIYGTGIRQTAEPVLAPIMTTQFLENLSGHTLGNYGICAGPVTLTIYQVITLNPQYTLDRLAAEIVCHRMLVECFLESEFTPEENWPKTVQDLVDNTPILPFHH